MINKKGSKAAKEIRDNTGIKLYSFVPKKGGKRKTQTGVDILVNYGLAGNTLNSYLKQVPSANKIPTLNKFVGKSKYGAVLEAGKAGILVPESKLELPKNAKADEWIEKKIHSIAGKGIQKASKKRRSIQGKYFQKFISDRVYELRVHSFMWMPIEQWTVQKRLGPQDEIAWNFHQGGHFVSIQNQNHRIFVEAKEIARKILEMRKMAFGAVDLLVDQARKVYFIEVNSSPGFSNLSGQIYFNAFNNLKECSVRDLKGIAY